MDFSIPPFEDAAMLMRYAVHFAQGHGIVWNIGYNPVDGSTDFLFMIATGLLNSLGIPIEEATRGLALFSHFLTIALIYFGILYIYKTSILPAAFSSLYFAIGPGLFLSAAYFGTSFFVLFVCIIWIAALRIIFLSRSNSSLIAFSLLSLITGLIRPEGVIIAIFMLVAIVLMIDNTKAKRLLLYFAVIFVVFGGIYFFWRWNYFGHPLPNPFYVKGGGTLYFSSLKMSIYQTIKLCYPFIPIFILGFRSKELRRLALVFSIPILGSTFMWILLSNAMNFGGRFQFPILPIVLLSWFPFVANLQSDLKLPKLSNFNFQTRTSVLVTIVIVIISVFLIQIYISTKITYRPDGKYDVAIMLNQYSNKNYTIATTEAGLLPLYSKWRAIDTWGLNDSWIAHNGGITRDYLDENKPEIIMWHGDFSPITPPSPGRRLGKWSRMVMQLKSYSEENNYILAAVFGETPYDTHYYYCSPNIPESNEIVSKIRNIEYKWYESGKKSINYAQFKHAPTVNAQQNTALDHHSTVPNDSR
ncbi:MAG: hypothetical protein HQ568_02605 [Calditrichaeota bacterium]|nr:hypothetical protein [Calditrichota bacterium]